MAILVVGHPAFGQEGDADDYETVITASMKDEDTLLSCRDTDVVGASKIEDASPKSTPELLYDAPGVFVQHTSYGGGAPIMRGLIGPQILLLVDGVRLSNSLYRTGPLQYLNLVDPMALDRIELLHGPGSVLYGSDAMGGVVQVFPLEPSLFGHEPGAEMDLLLRHASATNGFVGHAGAQAGQGGFGVLGTFTLMGLGNLVGGSDVGRQIHSGYDQWSTVGAVLHRFTDGYLAGWHVKLGWLASEIDDAGRTDKLFDKASLSIYDNQDVLVWGRLHADVSSIATRADLTLSFQRFFERKDTLSMKPDLISWHEGVRDEVTAVTLGLDVQLVTRMLGGRLWLEYGGMWYRDGVSADRFESHGLGWAPRQDLPYANGSTYTSYGVYILAGGDPLVLDDGHVLRLQAGYRFHGMGASSPAQLDLPAVTFQRAGHVGLASLQYLYRDLMTVAFTFSQGFRAPSLQESAMLGDEGKSFHTPNHELGPERADVFELLWRARLGRLSFGWVGSMSLLRDFIKRVPSTWQGQDEIGGKPVVMPVNAGAGRVLETTLFLRVDAGLGFSASGHMTFTWGEEVVKGGKDVPLTRIPPLFGMLSLRYDTPFFEWGAAFVETYVRWAARQARLSPEDLKDSRIPEGGTEGFFVWSFLAGIDMFRMVRLGLVLENVTNQKYRYHGSGLWCAGTNLVTTLELSF